MRTRVIVGLLVAVSAVAAAQSQQWRPSSGATPSPRVISIDRIQRDTPRAEQTVTVPPFTGQTENILVELGPSALGRCQLNVQRSSIRGFPIAIEVGCQLNDTWSLRSQTFCDSYDGRLDVSVPRTDGRGLVTWQVSCRGPGDPEGSLL
jgi:hypothetical protein